MEFFKNVDINIWRILLHILLFVGVLLVGRASAGIARRGLIRSLNKTTLTESLINLILTFSYYGILLVTIMIALIILGVPATAVVGIVALVLAILAVALQTSLGNLAATVSFLLFKPFEVGHIINTMGVFGVVKEIEIFSTVILAYDRITHVLPNKAIQDAGLANYSKNGIIRVDLNVGISYTSDMDKAKQVLSDVLAGHESVLVDPPSKIFVQKLNDSNVELATRSFVKIADYFVLQADLPELVKKAFDEAGIIIPYPQQDVHIIAPDTPNPV